MTGYSGTPLSKKLGIAPGVTIGLDGAPDGFVDLLHPLPEDVEFRQSGPIDMAVCFATRAADLERAFHAAMGRIPAHGAIWVSWPKRASKVETDITEDVCRELFLPTGLVDTKVCAIDATWSGLRFVVRIENRPGWPVRG